ncbi:adenylate kinase 4, mitochondrial-like [Artemia franciscana]|uniref:GTP:AMP phosphotransferase, mitochondrial n=1 Tax=Artemia franciscana TaxID=6661 RepID=A0AA88L1Q6_ARTSF|nr:hypothetical protein QYM36_010343 [Artemia franciscana]
MLPKKLIRAVILGPPASGKGTISNRISKQFNLKHLSAGDLLRSQIALETSAGMQAQKYIEKGNLVPDIVVVELISNELKELEKNGWVLDGYPRTIVQAKDLVKNYKIDAAICLDVPDDEIISRISGRWLHMPSGRVYNTEWNPPLIHGFDDPTGEPLIQRPDDHPGVIKRRLENYHRNMESILRMFYEEGILYKFRGRETNALWPLIKDQFNNIIKND